MEANARDLERIFDFTVSYQIPLFQRPYVWGLENWQPLWEDVEDILERNIYNQRPKPHFLGAVVLEQLDSATGSIQTRQVIDGQQRFTTLQMMIIAARDIAARNGYPKYMDRFNDLVTNRESKIDHKNEQYKVLPTNADRAAFSVVHNAGDPKAAKRKADQGNRLVQAYEYFHSRIDEWIVALQARADGLPSEDAMDALWRTIREGLQVVVIDLDAEDESQVIFETLNATGTQLLPVDLIKNFAFHEAQRENQDIDALYEEFWQSFDADFWRSEVKQGRLKRPRVDLFTQHYLSVHLRDEVRVTHLFHAFKAYVENGPRNSYPLTPVPETVDGHLAQFADYARSFEWFVNPPKGSRLSLFMDRLQAVDTATVYPPLLLATHKLLPDAEAEYDTLLRLIESFLIRRMACGLTAKNYNRLFIDLIRHWDRAGEVSVVEAARFLAQGEGESLRFPSDREFHTALVEYPVYSMLAKYKVRAVLEALDAGLMDARTEAVEYPNSLQVEHIMPVKWQDHWPLGVDPERDPTEARDARERRDRLVHTLGNLTLVTDKLNPKLSNGPWHNKRDSLSRYGRLNLTRSLLDRDAWQESEIQRRGVELADVAVAIWPHVERFDDGAPGRS